MSRFISAEVGNLPDPALAFCNRVYISQDNFNQICTTASTRDPQLNVRIDQFVFLASPHPRVKETEIGMNLPQRQNGGLTIGQNVRVSPFPITADVALTSITIGVDFLVKKEGLKASIDADQLAESFKIIFANQVFKVGQAFVMEFSETKIKLSLRVEELDHAALSSSSSAAREFGQVSASTSVFLRKQNGSKSGLSITGGQLPQTTDDLFKSDFDFEKMGIGGLDKQFKEIFRKAFASRMFPGVAKELGTNHVRGILLFGPPGCGKTLIARQIGKILKAREPKIVNGPEVLDKYVGGSEEKIRALFADAEEEQNEKGDASGLHIIIFDEMDAIMKTRGSGRGDSGVGDSIVNQLLSKIDGVDSLNNILLIGMTNRKDMIDEAILRPGRLEVHIEITLPDEAGRLQILNIKTADMKKNNRIAPEAIENMPTLAADAKNYTGAELEGLVRNAASFALARRIDPQNMKNVDAKSIRVEYQDFVKALSETVPAFGNKDNVALETYYSNGIVDYGDAFRSIQGSLDRLVQQVRTSERTPLLSVLLEGPSGTGKTAIAAKLAHLSAFPFVRMISPDTMIGESDTGKCNKLLRIFSDSYRSPLSIIFIDDIERLIEYTPVGSRFSNAVLQTLLILLRKVPPKPTRLLVIATTSIAELLEDLQLNAAFNVVLNVSRLQHAKEVGTVLSAYNDRLSSSEVMSIARSITSPISVKQLLLVLEMAQAESPDEPLTTDRFLACLSTIGFR